MDWLETVVTRVLVEDLGVPIDLVFQGNLFSRDILDSFDRVHLIELLETRFCIRITWTDVVPGNFDCVESIAQLLTAIGVERLEPMRRSVD